MAKPRNTHIQHAITQTYNGVRYLCIRSHDITLGKFVLDNKKVTCQNCKRILKTLKK